MHTFEHAQTLEKNEPGQIMASPKNTGCIVWIDIGWTFHIIDIVKIHILAQKNVKDGTEVAWSPQSLLESLLVEIIVLSCIYWVFFEQQMLKELLYSQCHKKVKKNRERLYSVPHVWLKILIRWELLLYEQFWIFEKTSVAVSKVFDHFRFSEKNGIAENVWGFSKIFGIGVFTKNYVLLGREARKFLQLGFSEIFGVCKSSSISHGKFFYLTEPFGVSSKEAGLNAIFDYQTKNFLSQKNQSTNSTETEFCWLTTQ